MNVDNVVEIVSTHEGASSQACQSEVAEAPEGVLHLRCRVWSERLSRAGLLRNPAMKKMSGLSEIMVIGGDLQGGDRLDACIHRSREIVERLLQVVLIRSSL